ncbi:hypothetical protein Vadar_006606 [Vaccinium darrowii]|uniref:Uncharacterized protein n=1 Tax=Vaccinium darrowii TaxID=229202 RepID=A0ACB7XG15_9ERIC|nr:hypothetical protein Vadar_006606 [Vaccinium darrowii]
MEFVRCTRVLESLARNGFGSIRCLSNSSVSPITSFVRRLIGVPNSQIKATLDAESDNHLTLKSLEFSWDALLSSLSASSPHKAHLVLEWRLEKIVKAKEENPGCYSELISMCGKIKNIPLAMQVFAAMEAHGIKPTCSIFNALVSACFSSGNLITALSLFEVMHHLEAYKPNSDTYNAFISAYANLGNEKAMESWYSARKAAGFSTDVRTYESLLSGCVKSKNFDGVDRFYEKMALSGVRPSIRILEMVLLGHCERRNLAKVKEFLEFILGGGYSVNVTMAEKLVRFFYDLGKVEEMEDLLATLMNSNHDVEVLSLVHYGIIRSFATLDRLDDVEYAFGRMLRHGISFKCSEDIDMVIHLYFRHAAYDRLEMFLECIKCSNHKLTRSSYDMLVAGYRRAGLSVKLDLVLNDMKLAGFL